MPRASDVALAHFFPKMFRRAHRQSENRHGRILPAAGHETRAVHHHQVLHIVALTPLVHYARFGIVPHAASADFMDAVSRWIYLVGLANDLPAGLME